MPVKPSRETSLLLLVGLLLAFSASAEEPAATVALDPSLIRAEISWADQFAESVYTISFPDSVIAGELFDVTLTAQDAFYPNDMIASPWSFLEDEAIVDDGFGLFLSDSSWESVYPFLFSEEGMHTFTFTAQDLGHGGGAHSWEWFEIGGPVHVVESASGVVGEGPDDTEFRLYRGSPSPFGHSTTISFDLKASVPTRLSVYDSFGRLVRTLVDAPSPRAGLHTIVWRGENDADRQVSSGVYFFHLGAGGHNETQRIVYIRP